MSTDTLWQRSTREGPGEASRREFILDFVFPNQFPICIYRPGHAGSVNVVLTLTKHRYLLYVEDDWWASYDSPLPPQSGVGNVLWRAMEVLTKSTEQVSQASGVEGGDLPICHALVPRYADMRLG